MSFSGSGKELRIAASLFLVLSISVFDVDAQDAGATSTNSPALASATAGAPPKRPVNRLLLLEERITRALKGLSSDSSIEPSLPRPPAPVVRQAPRRNKADEEELASQHDWMLMNPDDFAEHEASLEFRKLLRDTGMLQSGKLAPDEQFLRDLSIVGSGTRGIVDSMNSRELQDRNKRENESTPANVVQSEERLRNMLDQNKSGTLGESSLRQNGLSSLFGAPSEDLAARERQESYVEAYRNFISPTPAATAPGDFASSALGRAATDPSRSPAVPGLGGLDSERRSSGILGPQFGSINPVLSPRAPLDTSDQVLNQWNKFYTPSVPEPSRAPAPPKSTFEAPRRKF